MEISCTRNCGDCPGRFICRCLKITEDEVVQAATSLGLQTVTDVRRATGAGDGCTACHRALRRVLEMVQPSSSSPPICSVR